MTVQDLIKELQAYAPQRPVRVMLGSVIHMDQIGLDDVVIHLSEADATEVDDVSDQGAFVLVRGH